MVLYKNTKLSKDSMILKDYWIDLNSLKRYTENISAMLPGSWKKLFNSGVIIPNKMRFCNECRDEIPCTMCSNQFIENKEFEANLSELKRHLPNVFGHWLPYYIL